jgi:hypothetical protein
MPESGRTFQRPVTGGWLGSPSKQRAVEHSGDERADDRSDPEKPELFHCPAADEKRRRRLRAAAALALTCAGLDAARPQSLEPSVYSRTREHSQEGTC